MYGRQREPYTMESACNARNYYKTVILKEPGYQQTFYKSTQHTKSGSVQPELRSSRPNFGSINPFGSTGFKADAFRPDMSMSMSTTGFRQGQLQAERLPQALKNQFTRLGDGTTQVYQDISQRGPAFKFTQTNIPQIRLRPFKPEENLKVQYKTVRRDYYHDLGFPYPKSSKIYVPAGSVTYTGPFYTRDGYTAYTQFHEPIAGITGIEYAKTKERLKNDYRSKPGQGYFEDAEKGAAGVTSNEYEEIKRRAFNTRPTKINYDAYRKRPDYSYTQQTQILKNEKPFTTTLDPKSSHHLPPQHNFQVPQKTLTPAKIATPVHETYVEKTIQVQEPTKSNFQYQVENQTATQSMPVQEQPKPQYKFPEGERTIERPPVQQSEEVRQIYQQSQELYHPIQEQQQMKQTMPEPPKQTFQYQEEIPQATQTIPTQNQTLKSKPKAPVGGGKIIESNESTGVQEALNQNYIHNVNNYQKNFGGEQPNPKKEQLKYYDYKNWDMPTEARPQLKQGVESNESYGVSDALNANFVPYDGSVGPREILAASEYGPRTGGDYKIGGGNESAGVGGIFQGP